MPDFELSAELTPVLARFMAQRSPVEVSRAGGAGCPPLWTALVEEVGVAGLLVEEAYDGQGATVVELAAAVHEAARCGWSGPLVATAGVAVTLLATLDPADAHGLRAAIATRGRVVVTAFHEDARGTDLAAAAVVRRDGERWLLRGTKQYVDSGTHADAVLVSAVDGSGTPTLCLTEVADPGVTVRAMEAVDPGRGLAVVELDDVVVTVVASGDDVAPALQDAWLTGALLLAADAVGTADRVLELSLAYAREREQFGRPVATFQSVKHKLVDMHAELETARSMLRHALERAAAGEADWRTAASAAKARAADAAMHVAREGVQVHGGIGFTWEHEISHHFRRATAVRALHGTPSDHRARVAEGLGL
ncbi:acyl-CoA dehydrogenase family protein [Nocardioides lianchengensis]|uniref:Acyl-CoA dehydrogenase n=1 Tax=Nocardioides lianchengensis TaxID=1045774 RepID=A0A1G7BKR3_9ACTN|nr:acyl-CoA dehydrogenase family protein [Nocardioides lianchengensis]NYG08983.1 alkylation response protein AidB-like acyl-CoA dehydrogenase [Nocardioides lianchengensis]SDE26885.1 Acyl-CoA dehydrogenase [Nocardioides lianchengensis]